MAIVASVLYLVVLVFLVLLFVRLVLDWVMIFAREWRPRGVMLVVAEATYTVTDPPLRAVRRVVPSVTLGTVRLDLAFTVLMILCFVLLAVLASLAT